MSTFRKTRTKWLTGIAVSCLALALALTHAPAAADTSIAGDEPAPLSVFVSFPLGEIQNGQFCQAVANVTGGSGGYTFEWSGQFEGPGLSSPPGVINGFIDSSRDHWLKVVVTDSNQNTATHTSNFTIGQFNEECAL